MHIFRVIEVVSAFFGRDGIEKLADPCPDVFDGAFAGLSEKRLELGEGELDGVEVRRIWRLEEKARARRLDEAASLVSLVAAQVVEDDDVGYSLLLE